MSQKAIWVRQGSIATAETVPSTACAVEQPAAVRRVRVLAEADSRVESLPPFPTVMSELIGLTNSDKSVAQDLRVCIEKDAVLTARILRIANSVFYSPVTPVTSVHQAVVMLGFLSVKSLAMAAATLKFLGQEMRAYGISPGGLWMHSYAVAELARDLASYSGESFDTQDTVYVSGLLHDIGKIVLAGMLEATSNDAQNRRRSGEGEGTRDWEIRTVGVCHCEVGERLAEKWRLAPVTSRSVRYHHDWTESPGESQREVMLVALADHVARRLGVGLTGPEENQEEEGRILDALGLPLDMVEEIVDRYAKKSSQVESLFSNIP